MMSFPQVILTDFLEVVGPGITPFAGKKKYVATGSLETGRIIGFEEVDYESRPSRANMEAKEGDLFFAKMKDTKKIYVVSKDDTAHLYSTGFTILRIKDRTQFAPKFIYYWLRTREFQDHKNKECTGATQKAFAESKLKNFKLPKPPVSAQNKIVSILEKAESLKASREEADRLTDELLKSVFYEMFGDPFKNPKKWPIVLFEDLIVDTPQNGLYKHSSFYTDGPEGTPILRIDSFYGGRLEKLENLKRVKCTQDEIQKFKLQNGEIVINRVNSLEYLGKCGLIKDLKEPTVYESNMMRMIIDRKKAEPTFLIYLLCTGYVKNQILSRAKKAVNQASINQTDVNSLSLFLPPVKIQIKFSRIIDDLEQMRVSQQQSKKRIDDLADVLMQKAFRGELIP